MTEGLPYLPWRRLLTSLGSQAFCLHEPTNPFLAAGLAQIPQVFGDLAVTIHTLAL
jgi:hypothetical protein